MGILGLRTRVFRARLSNINALRGSFEQEGGIMFTCSCGKTHARWHARCKACGKLNPQKNSPSKDAERKRKDK